MYYNKKIYSSNLRAFVDEDWQVNLICREQRKTNYNEEGPT